MTITNNELVFYSLEEARKVLLQEGKKLEQIARLEWDKYLHSYKPVEYKRTGNSAKAIKLGGVIPIGENKFGIELTWVNNLVYHDSWLYKKGKTSTNKRGHAIMLIGTRWHSKKLEKVYRKRVYRHTYWQWEGANGLDGTSYLDNIVKKYEQIKDPRINIEIQWSGKFLK